MRGLLATLVLLLASSLAQAEQSVRGEGFVVHWSAMNTSALTPETAAQLSVQRRASHALVLLSPRRDPDSAEPLGAVASGVVRRLTGQRQLLSWREIRVGTQTDLIAEFEIPDGEQLAFDLSVKPDGASYPLGIRFNQQFYRE